MFEKSIIYLLFPTLLGSYSFEYSNEYESSANLNNNNSMLKVVELGVEEVKTKFENINFTPVKKLVDDALFFNKSTVNKSANVSCQNYNQEEFCVN